LLTLLPTKPQLP